MSLDFGKDGLRETRKSVICIFKMCLAIGGPGPPLSAPLADADTRQHDQVDGGTSMVDG